MEFNVVPISYDGEHSGICSDVFPCRCFQRGGGEVGDGIGISAGWVSNMMLRLTVIAHSCDLLARFGLVRLLFVVRHVKCLSEVFVEIFDRRCKDCATDCTEGVAGMWSRLPNARQLSPFSEHSQECHQCRH